MAGAGAAMMHSRHYTVEQASAARLDTRCAQSEFRPPFAVP